MNFISLENLYFSSFWHEFSVSVVKLKKNAFSQNEPKIAFFWPKTKVNILKEFPSTHTLQRYTTSFFKHKTNPYNFQVDQTTIKPPRSNFVKSAISRPTQKSWKSKHAISKSIFSIDVGYNGSANEQKS